METIQFFIPAFLNIFEIAFPDIIKLYESVECCFSRKVCSHSYQHTTKRVEIGVQNQYIVSQSRSQFLFCLPLAGKSPLLLCQPYDEREGQNSVVFHKLLQQYYQTFIISKDIFTLEIIYIKKKCKNNSEHRLHGL